jgi:uncharacterized SAM-binding protein YcdF (DUF218 family)
MRTLAVLLALLLIWTAGLLSFVSRVQHSTPAADPTPADGIVTLTGASDQRIEAATTLLQQGLGQRLLVSGVNPTVRRSQVRRLTGAQQALYDCCIDLGFEAPNTLGNARETAEWARTKNYRSLILVTADFHMPRAMLELHSSMPEAIIQSYPIPQAPLDAQRWWMTTRGAERMSIEYCKYLAILFREAILGLGGHPAPPTNAAAPPFTPAAAPTAAPSRAVPQTNGAVP